MNRMKICAVVNQLMGLGAGGICTLLFSHPVHYSNRESIEIGQQIDFKFSLETYVLGSPEQKEGYSTLPVCLYIRS